MQRVLPPASIDTPNRLRTTAMTLEAFPAQIKLSFWHVHHPPQPMATMLPTRVHNLHLGALLWSAL